MEKEVEIYNMWFEKGEDHTQANILNAIKMGIDSSASNNGNTLVSGALTPDCTAWLIPDNNRVGSILSAALRLLSQEQMIVLRDCLIERTPKAMTD